MNFSKLSSFPLGLVLTALLVAMTVGVAGGDSHIITDEYIDVEPDGYWNAEVAPEGHQQWSFDLAEPRDHNILIAIVEPVDASLDISLDGEDLGGVSDDEQGFFAVSLEAGSHAVTISNSGEVPVQYDLYMGFVAPTVTTIVSDNPDPSAINQPVTVVYTVETDLPGVIVPTGMVIVSASASAATCGSTVAVGQCDLTLTSAGARTLTASYNGDGFFQASSDTESHTVLSVIPVSIDIKPGGDSNPINRRSMGLVPVAILGSTVFDVTNVNVITLRIGPCGSESAAPKHDLTVQDVLNDHLEFVNANGYLDLVSHYRQNETGLSLGDTEACLVGQTLSGVSFEGHDSVRVK